MGWIRRLFNKQKQRRNVHCFVAGPPADSATPALARVGGTPEVPFTLPANIELLVRSAAPVAAGTKALEVNGDALYCPALQPGQVWSLGWHEKWRVVTPETGFEVLINMGLGRYEPIGAGA